MATASEFDIGHAYDFNTYAQALLGTFKNVTVVGIANHQTAQQYIDVAAKHAQVIGSVPEGEISGDFRKYYYLIVQYSNGQTTALGLPWIRSDSISLKGTLDAVIRLSDVKADDYTDIKRALSAAGFNVTSVEID